MVNRVEKGDNTAFADAAKERTTFAIGFIKHYLRISAPSSQQYQAGVAALRTVEGYADYYKKKAADALSKGGIDEDAFEMLGIVGTPETQAAVAPYLFDWTTLYTDGFPNRHTMAYVAASSLEQMRIQDGPASGGGGEGIAAWQRWVIRHGYVPKDWESRVGLPESERKMFELTHQPPGPPLGATANPVPIRPPLRPGQLAPAVPASQTPTMHAEPKHPLISGVAVAFGVGLLLIAVTAWRLRQRR